MSASATEERLVDVELRGLPVARYREAQEHFESLRREFALILHSEDPDAVPHRLLRVVTELQARFGAFSGTIATALDQAERRGDATVDLVVRIPESAREASLEFEALLDEADEFCRRGDLLTLETPPAVVAFRRWYLHQFVDQLAGAPPVSWQEWEERSEG